MAITDEEKAKRKAERAKWFEEEARRTAVLKEKLAEEHGVKGNPKADLLFSKAWELGHAYGEHEVSIYYADLVDLIR